MSQITYRGITPPSTQNLKALGLWVFFLICYSTFSFLPNVGLRLTLEYLTISPSSESHSSSTLIHSPSNGSILNPSTLLMTPHLYRRSHTYTGHACLKSPSGRLSIQGQTVLAKAANQRLWYHLIRRIRGGKHWGDLTRMRTEPTYKEMTPPSTQNFKALGLWVFFHICCSTFSFLLNVELRLTLGYLTISPSSVSPSSTTLIHSPSSGSNLNPSTLLMTPHLYRRSHTYTEILMTPHLYRRSHTYTGYSWPLTCTAVHTLIRDTLAWNHH